MIIKSGWQCPSCSEEEGFIARVSINDYAELEKNVCEHCGHILSQEEEQNILDRAFERAPEDADDQYGDFVLDRERDR